MQLQSHDPCTAIFGNILLYIYYLRNHCTTTACACAHFSSCMWCVASLNFDATELQIFKVILEAQVTQICSMDILRLTIGFIKMSKVWSLCRRMATSCHQCAIELHTYIRTKLVDIFIKSTIRSGMVNFQKWMIFDLLVSSKLGCFCVVV